MCTFEVLAGGVFFFKNMSKQAGFTVRQVLNDILTDSDCVYDPEITHLHMNRTQNEAQLVWNKTVENFMIVW